MNKPASPKKQKETQQLLEHFYTMRLIDGLKISGRTFQDTLFIEQDVIKLNWQCGVFSDKVMFFHQVALMAAFSDIVKY